MEYGNKLNPTHSWITPHRIKGTRQKITITHNPSEIDQNQLLLVRFPDLSSNDVIVPGMVNQSFNIELSSEADPNRTLVNNIGRATVKKLAIKFDGNIILEVDDFDIFACYQDLWKTKLQKRDFVRQGIISDDGCMANCIKLRINSKEKGASNPLDIIIANAYGNKFIIPLEFEMLDSVMPCYQSGLRNQLCYKIMFNEYGKVINAMGPAATLDDTYKIMDIALEYKIVTQLDLAKNISEEYQSMVLLYDRVIRHVTKPVNMELVI